MWVWAKVTLHTTTFLGGKYKLNIFEDLITNVFFKWFVLTLFIKSDFETEKGFFCIYIVQQTCFYVQFFFQFLKTFCKNEHDVIICHKSCRLK